MFARGLYQARTANIFTGVQISTRGVDDHDHDDFSRQHSRKGGGGGGGVVVQQNKNKVRRPHKTMNQST